MPHYRILTIDDLPVSNPGYVVIKRAKDKITAIEICHNIISHLIYNKIFGLQCLLVEEIHMPNELLHTQDIDSQSFRIVYHFTYEEGDTLQAVETDLNDLT